jgi:hypothetical protein
MERYKGIKRHEVPPHVFAITDTAYRSMLQGNYTREMCLRTFLLLFIAHSTLLIFHCEYDDDADKLARANPFLFFLGHT